VADPILEVTNLKKYFRVTNGVLKAVDNVNLSIRLGETFGLVGESGCGKSTLGRTIMRLYNTTEGQVLFNGENVHQLKGKRLKQFNREMQMVFQDPYASLNPRMTVGDIIAEGIDIHGLCSGVQRRERVAELLQTVGLPEEHASRFPHEFSGGQRQRIGIARALAIKPQFIVADEPVSALDVSVQAQVINLFKRLQKENGLTYLFISHDLAMVKHIADRCGVMYLGALMEVANASELYRKPLHPYTIALLSAIPIPDPEVERKRERIILEGDVPSPINPPPGCRFFARCPKARPECQMDAPLWLEVEKEHFVACHLYK
jgi:oligopeptide/dipeptide ABC transporter ATP-binding protein